MNVESTLKIKIDNEYLENSKSEKVLGVTIDESLYWTEQVDKTCKKKRYKHIPRSDNNKNSTHLTMQRPKYPEHELR